MSYYKALGLHREPFSLSPDPGLFYRSAEHLSALERLEFTIRMRRGLSLVLGDVGTGKTTVGRVLIQSFREEKDVEFHLILNPLYQSEFQFLEALCRMFGVAGGGRSTMDCLDALQGHLYENGVTRGKTTVLLIDEGQNLTANLIEVLRSLLNYETNEHKLLQLVVLAQLEALPKLNRVSNFMDRVNMKYIINPLREEETRRMVEFRLKEAGLAGPGLFTGEAVRLVHEKTLGYPRRINRLCQRSLEYVVGRGKSVVDGDVVRSVWEESSDLDAQTAEELS